MHLDIHDPVFTFAVALSAVLLVPMLFRRFRLPDIVGLITAGIVLGPHATGLIHSDSFVQPFGQVGLLYLMFLAGLEIDMHRFRREKRNSLVFGGITFLVPMVVGVSGALLMLGMDWAAALLLASMFASHTLLPYPIVQKLGLVKARSVTTAVGGTVLTDTLALLVLAVVAESAGGDLSTGFWVRLWVLLAVYVAVAFLTIPALGRWFFRRFSYESMPGFLFVIVIAYSFAALAPLAGLEPIIGAFLSGLALNLLIPERSRLMIRLGFVGESFFIPLFLISVGLMVNVSTLLDSGRVWVLLVFMVTGAYMAKYLAARLAGRLLGFSSSETGLLFGLSVNQTAATLAAVVVGVNLGIFSEDVLNGTILMILATCAMGPIITDRHGRALAMEGREEPLSSSGAPERVMIPVSSADQIEPLMSLAVLVRNPEAGQDLYPTMIVGSSDDSEEMLAEAERILAGAVVMAVEADVGVRPVTRLAGATLEGLMAAARDSRISTIILDEDYAMERDPANLPVLVADADRQMVLRAMNLGSLNTAARMLVAVPPLMEKQSGFAQAWEAVSRLALQTGAHPLIIGEEATLLSMRRLLGRSDGLLSRADTAYLEDWHGAADMLFSLYGMDDLLVIMAARTGRLAWQPSQERMIGQLERKLKALQLIVLHPPEMKWETAEAESRPAVDFREIFPPGRVLLHMTETDGEEALRILIKKGYGQDEALEEECLRQLRESPLWLSGDCVMVHTHEAGPPAPMALLATARNGFDLNGRTARILLLLLGTPGETPEEHLGRLAVVAGMLHGKETASAVVETSDYDTLSRMLSDNTDGG